jgi:hypothetical protein
MYPLQETMVGAAQVNCVTLADIIETGAISQVDLLKLDCEGCEFEILLDIPARYLKRIRAISLEFHDHLTQYRHHHIIQHLQSNDFETVVVRKQGTYGIIHAFQSHCSE